MGARQWTRELASHTRSTINKNGAPFLHNVNWTEAFWWRSKHGSQRVVWLQLSVLAAPHTKADPLRHKLQSPSSGWMWWKKDVTWQVSQWEWSMAPSNVYWNAGSTSIYAVAVLWKPKLQFTYRLKKPNTKLQSHYGVPHMSHHHQTCKYLVTHFQVRSQQCTPTCDSWQAHQPW